jgi:hypothetical protein
MESTRAEGIRPSGFEINYTFSESDLVGGFSVIGVETCLSLLRE